MSDNGWASYEAARNEHQSAVSALAEVSTDRLWTGKGERGRLVEAVVATNEALNAARTSLLGSYEFPRAGKSV